MDKTCINCNETKNKKLFVFRVSLCKDCLEKLKLNKKANERICYNCCGIKNKLLFLKDKNMCKKCKNKYEIGRAHV